MRILDRLIIRSSPSGGESDVLSGEFDIPLINIIFYYIQRNEIQENMY